MTRVGNEFVEWSTGLPISYAVSAGPYSFHLAIPPSDGSGAGHGPHSHSPAVIQAGPPLLTGPGVAKPMQ